MTGPVELIPSNNGMADAIRSMVLSLLNSKTTQIRDSWLYAQWYAAESSDANLSQVILPDGEILRGVPKNSAAGSLVSGDVVLLAVPRAGPVCIICKISGNYAAYEG